MSKNKGVSGNTPIKFEDVSSSSRPKGVGANLKYFLRHKIRPFFLRNHKRNLKALLSIVGCLAVFGGLMALWYTNSLLSKITYDEGFSGDINATFEEEEDISYRSMYDITDAESLKDLLKAWSTNGGELISSKNVINVLLIGQDDDDGSHRSDSMMLVSLNKKTEQIFITSFLRDSYTYMNINGSERYDKTNHSFAWGGPDALIEVLQNNYKIKIDHYVTINFKSFVKAINAVGGVDVPVTEAEANYMNRTTHFDDFTSGDNVHLDGSHALIFSRIRYLDGEAERTDRQKLVIKSLINKAKSAKVSQLSDLIDSVLPYVTTNYSKREIFSLGSQALTKGWLNFTINTLTEPVEEYRKGVEMRTWSYSNLFVWVVDYPMCAQELQTKIYGTSNIQIDAVNHQSALDMLVNNSGYSDSDSGGYSYSYYSGGSKTSNRWDFTLYDRNTTRTHIWDNTRSGEDFSSVAGGDYSNNGDSNDGEDTDSGNYTTAGGGSENVGGDSSSVYDGSESE